MIKKIISYVITVCILCSALAMLYGCEKDNTPENGKTVIRINEVTHSIFYAPFYAAINLGYFSDVGIEIELINGGGSDKSMTAVITGDAQIGLMGPETAVYVCNEGKEDHAVIIAQLTKRDGSFLLGKTPDEDFNWEKLRGTSIIGGRKGGMPQMTLEHVLRSHGLIPGKDITVRTDVSFDLMGGAFIAGDDAYVTLFEPSASAVQNANQGYIVTAVGATVEEIPYTCFMVKKDYLSNNRAMLEKFVDSLYKGQQWIKSSDARLIAEVIAPSFPDSDISLIETVVKNYKAIDVWMNEPILKEEAYNSLIALIKEAGIINSAPEYGKLIDNSLFKRAES